MKKLRVIMPRYANTFENHALTERCITEIFQCTDERFETNLTVVDNGSKVPFVTTSMWKGMDYIEHGSNLGVAPAWNTGWKAHPHDDFYCWINSDCEVTKGWSYPLVVAAEQLPVIAMPYTNGVKSDGIGITGWCFLASRETAERIGFFDELFAPAQYEDTDWFHRAIFEHRIALVNVPTSNVLHERQRGGSKELPNFNERWKYLHNANRFRYAWKHGVDPSDIPPFWKKPLPEVELEESNASQL